MKQIAIFVTLIIAILISGCAASRGFNRVTLREEIGQKIVINEKEIQEALSLKPQLPKPFRIGVYVKDSEQKWRWSEEDKNKLLSWGDQLKKDGQISDVFFINSDLASKDDIKSIRLAAAQHGADAVLIVNGITDIDSYNTKWGWTYIAIVPMLFVPGNQQDAIFLARATLWDVKNQYLYLTAESESIRSETISLVSKNERPLIESTKADAILRLSEELSQRVQQLSAK